MNSDDTRKCISSTESPGGPTPSDSPESIQGDLFGPGHVRASPSVKPGKDRARTMRATSGPCGSNSSASAALQRSLASRLQARLAETGSPLYALTWSSWAMPWGPPICALRASALRTSGNGSSGWPTPQARDHKTGQGHRFVNPDRSNDLNDCAALAGWATPSASEMRTHDRDKLIARRKAAKAKAKNGNGFGLTLGNEATMYLAETGDHAQLNPEFPRWLMGFPAAWSSSGGMATRSSPK